MNNKYERFSHQAYHINLPSQVEYVLNKLNQNGFEAFVVGGCVRDSLLKKLRHDIIKKINDWDITTSATPDEMLPLFGEHICITNAAKYGTISVVLDDIPYEITSYRRDTGYSDHRHPNKIEYTNSLEQDCSRRDFTINALAYSHQTGVIDMFDGISDLKTGIIRCIQNANDRFNEDALRMLRALRFAATFGFQIEAQTTKAIFKNIELLDEISGERKFMELFKMANTFFMAEILKTYKSVLFQIIPELKPCDGFDQKNKHHCYDVFGHIMQTVYFACHRECGPYVVLAALFHDIGKPDTYCLNSETNTGTFYHHAKKGEEITRNILTKFHCSNEIKDRICFLVSKHDINYPETIASARRMIANHSEVQISDIYNLKMCDLLAHSAITINKYMPIRTNSLLLLEQAKSDMNKENTAFTIKSLDINGDDLIAMGLKQGKEIGLVLRTMLDSVIAGNVKNQREDLIKLIPVKY